MTLMQIPNSKFQIPISPSRLEAFHILLRVEQEQAYASNLLSSAKFDDLSSEDRRLVYELVLGVLRWQLQLDHYIEHYANRPVKKLDVPILIALRLGLYQIRFLERIPDWAAVNESVQLVRQHKLASAARLVNAILRQACRTRHIDICEQIEDDREQLAARFSHPRWLVEKWLMEWGREETTELLQADNSTPVTTIRLNPLTGDPEQSLSQLEHEGLSLSPSEFVEGAYRVTNGPMTESSTLVREGKIYIQDEASQLITSILDPRPGLRVLDVCAAPGSKATQMAAAMLNQGFIMAGDIHEHRLRNLQQISQRLGAAIIHPVVMDGRQPLPIIPHRQFDRVFVDAPCSGTGTLRRHPEIKWRLQPEDLTALAELQITLLASAAMMLAPGGRLVYSTCSLEPQENEHVVEQFLKNHPHFRLIPSGAHPALLTDKGYVRTFPHRHHMDGFFAAVVTTHA